MSSSKITYRKLRKYKYQLRTDYSVIIDIKKEVANDFIKLAADGSLTIKEKYAWDGPSGPTIDTKNFMRASLVHDALYQLMREGSLDRKADRKLADQIFRKLCREDKMWRFRAAYAYLAVRWFGGSAAKADNTEDIIYYAP